MNLIYFILIIGIVIILHELGHFISAKKAGVYVYEFSIGMGPKLHTFRRKNDSTEYNLRLFPIGGFVAMAGETEPEGEKEIPKKEQLVNKSWGIRMRTMLAGVCMNFLLALVVFFIIGLVAGSATNECLVYSVKDDYPAKEYLVEGDQLLKMNGKDILSYDQLQVELMVNNGQTATFTVKHQDGTIDTYAIGSKTDTDEKGNKSYHFGFSITTPVEHGFVAAIKYSFRKFFSLFHQMILILGYLFMGKIGLNSLSGPIGIYDTIKTAAAAGFINIIYLLGYISLDVGFINLLPLPAMDGGHVFFLIIEKLKGSKVDPKLENTIHMIGFILLFALMIFVTWHDIMNVLGK
jgi:regulator of sigma E protease